MNTADKGALRVLVIADSVGFPDGMAGTSRIRLVSKALVQQGVAVKVMCVWVSERSPVIENRASRGTYAGVEFEYTTGTTLYPESFWVRRWVELRGLITALYRLLHLKLRNEVDCVYSYISMQNLTRNLLLFRFACKLLGIPVIVDLGERPWTLQLKKGLLSRIVSPLTGATGVVTISAFLSDWVRAESERLGRQIAVLQMPILADVYEQYPRVDLIDSPTVMFAASPSYEETTDFILDSMPHVWKRHPSCRLVVSGYRPGSKPEERLKRSLRSRGFQNRVDLVGYLERSELLRQYSGSSGLLIPLFADVSSRARFPTKIGEYAASARPIITTSAGEIPRFFRDGVNAFVCQQADPACFGEKIVQALDDPDKATQIGLAGRELARVHFHYTVHAERLAAFLRSLVR